MTDTNPLERYSRQMRFPGLGKAGQEKLLASRVTLCGCGASAPCWRTSSSAPASASCASSTATSSSRATSSGRCLFDEADVASNLPKAEAAATKLATDQLVGHGRADRRGHQPHQHRRLCARTRTSSSDGSDNFEIRYLINDVAIKHNKPWVYGGAVWQPGDEHDDHPRRNAVPAVRVRGGSGPGETWTCETAGVLAPAVNIVASYQATEAIKLLSGNKAAVNRELLILDVWENTNRRVKVAPLAGRKGECPCCARRNFEWLDGDARDTNHLALRSTTRCR